MENQAYSTEEWAGMMKVARALMTEEDISVLQMAGDDFSDAYWNVAAKTWELIERAEKNGVKERAVIDAIVAEEITKSTSSVRHYRGVLMWYAERITQEEFPGNSPHWSMYKRARDEYYPLRFEHFKFAMAYPEHWRAILGFGVKYMERWGRLPTTRILEEHFKNEIFASQAEALNNAPQAEGNGPMGQEETPWVEPDEQTGDGAWANGPWNERAIIEHFNKPIAYMAEQAARLPVNSLTRNRILGELRGLAEAIELAKHELKYGQSATLGELADGG